MPNNRVNQTAYTGTGGPEQYNVATLYKPGELGGHTILGGKEYQLIQLDSGATASTSAGAPVAGHLVFWKSRASYLVTNDKAQCENAGNAAACASVAGVLCSTKTSSQAGGDATITAGNYGYMQVKGTHGFIYSGSVTAAAGDQLSANTAVATASIQKVTPGATAPVAPVIAVATAATASNYTAGRIGGNELADVD